MATLELVCEEHLEELQQEPLEELDVHEVLHNRRKYWICKRIQDILLASAALLVLWPLMAVVALIIYLDDPHGSPIFVQTRVGRKGKLFRFYKFRSMYVHAEEMLEDLMDLNEMDGPVFKIKEDPRITRIGKIIRKTSIDELPQLWNILKGDMTIVGPRPALPREVAQYDEKLRQRLYVTPGLTCYWQIQPNRNELTFRQWMDLDLQYIQERSFLVDWKIIFKTFGAVLGAEGV